MSRYLKGSGIYQQVNSHIAGTLDFVKKHPDAYNPPNSAKSYRVELKKLLVKELKSEINRKSLDEGIAFFESESGKNFVRLLVLATQKRGEYVLKKSRELQKK